MPEILTPDCPLCGQPPLWVLGAGTQAFCGSDDCEVFTWDPTRSRDEFLRTAKRIELEVEGGTIQVKDSSEEDGDG